MSNLVERASAFAIEKHRGQTRKVSGIAYAFHPATVAWLLTIFKQSKNKDMLTAALLLHDIVEDCGVTFWEIEREFGTNVAALVMELTNDKSVKDKSEQERLMIQKLLTMSTYALAAKLCDILHNLSDIDGEDTFSRNFITKTKKYVYALETSDRKLTGSHVRILNEIKTMLIKYGR